MGSLVESVPRLESVLRAELIPCMEPVPLLNQGQTMINVPFFLTKFQEIVTSSLILEKLCCKIYLSTFFAIQLRPFFDWNRFQHWIWFQPWNRFHMWNRFHFGTDSRTCWNRNWNRNHKFVKNAQNPVPEPVSGLES